MTFKIRRGLALAVLATTIAGCAGAIAVPSDGNVTPLARVLRVFSYDYEPFDSPAQLADAADTVIVGRISGVSGGRTLEAGPQATLTVAVETTIKGQEASTIFVEIPTAAGAEVDDIRAAIPQERVLLFLADRSAVPGTGNSGTPSGSRIFTPYPQGVIMEDGQRFVGGIEDLGEMSPQWNRPTDFDSFVADLIKSQT